MFTTQYNYIYDESKMEIISDKTSLTFPDMSYTVRQLLEKFTFGQPVRVFKEGIFEDDPSFDYIDPTRSGDFDLSDITALEIELAQLESNIEIARQAIADKKASETTSEATEVSEA